MDGEYKMGLSESLKDKLKDKLKGFIKGGGEARVDPFAGQDDFETRDRVLKATRRLRRRQMDIVEKRQLDKTILAFNRREASRAFIGESLFKTGMDGKSIKKKRAKQSFMDGSGFLGKGGF